MTKKISNFKLSYDYSVFLEQLNTCIVPVHANKYDLRDVRTKDKLRANRARRVRQIHSLSNRIVVIELDQAVRFTVDATTKSRFVVITRIRTTGIVAVITDRKDPVMIP